MESMTIQEEKLRQACCEGNEEAVKFFLKCGVNVNSANGMNGWTALHWAAKRQHVGICKLLCESGGNKTATNHKNETPVDLASCESVIKLLANDKQSDAATGRENSKPDDISFVPNYLANPVFVHSLPLEPGQSKPHTSNKADMYANDNSTTNVEDWFWYQPPSITLVGKSNYSPCGLPVHPEKLVLKVRIVSDVDLNFTEMTIDRKSKTTMFKFKNALIEHFGSQLKSRKINFLRKLPNTIIQQDEDIKRLTDYQEVEVGLCDNFMF